MGRRAIRLLAAASLLAAALLVPGRALAQGGITVVTGLVTSNGQPAPSGTVVLVTLPTGVAVGVALTGQTGFAANQYRIDLPTTTGLDGQLLRVQALINGAAQPVVATAPAITFASNRVFTINVNVADPTELPLFTALNPLTSPEITEIITTFDYFSGTYLSYVPGLPGNTFTTVKRNTVLIMTLKRDALIVVGGPVYAVRAGVPTPIPIGTVLTVFLQ